ncbi:MAG: nucleotide disphospho-sugar-binding domain-containing protein [Actinophytocola sp.]|uniref:glycosyltransferase n=1 Tax=Actinophytocola sp. TaxID=1872138 RepID=UPI003C7368D0
MHLLFLSRPASGHLYPTLRLAEELGERGHHVTFASGDPYLDELAGPGVRLVRFGKHERRLLDMPALAPDAVVADPRTTGAATDLAGTWDVPLVVAGQNLAESPHGWPSEQAPEPYVFTIPGARGKVHNPWRRHGRRPVLLVDGPSIGPLVRAFGDTDWQVVVSDTELPHADVLLTDGRLAAVSAGLRAGVPMVLAPKTAEEIAHADRIAALGVGKVVASLADAHAEDLRRLVEHLRVDEPTLATARRLRELVAEAGAPARAADRIEELLVAPPLARAA